MSNVWLDCINYCELTIDQLIVLGSCVTLTLLQFWEIVYPLPCRDIRWHEAFFITPWRCQGSTSREIITTSTQCLWSLHMRITGTSQMARFFHCSIQASFWCQHLSGSVIACFFTILALVIGVLKLTAFCMWKIIFVQLERAGQWRNCSDIECIRDDKAI